MEFNADRAPEQAVAVFEELPFEVGRSNGGALTDRRRRRLLLRRLRRFNKSSPRLRLINPPRSPFE